MFEYLLIWLAAMAIAFNPILDKVNDHPVTIFLKDSATSEQVQELEQEFQTIDGVTSVTYTSKEDAYNKFKEENKDNPSLNELMTPDLLPASLEVHTTSTDTSNEVRKIATDSAAVDDAMMRESVADLAGDVARGQ